MKNNKLNEINKIFLIFMIGSIIGYIVEMIVALVQEGHLVSAGVAILMIFNITISSMAALRQKERKYNIQATSQIDVFLDENYPDEYMNKIFANKIER